MLEAAAKKARPSATPSKAISYAFTIFRPDCALRDPVRRLIGDDRAFGVMRKRLGQRGV